MRRVFRACIGVVAVVGAGVLAQTVPDSLDSVCVTYRLNALEEAQYVAGDGQLAAFWDEWDTQNSSSFERDFITMLPATNAQPGRDYYTGPEDNTLIIRAAYGEQGIYLLVEMIDDDFIDRHATNDDTLHQDIIELYIDTLSALEISQSTDALVGLYSSTLTYYTIQFVLSVGGATTYDDLRMSYYDDNLWSWQDTWLTFAQAATLYDSISFDQVTVSGTRKAQEWFLPWSTTGNGGIANPVPPEGKRFAFAGGCHDMDIAQGDTVCSLKWKNRANPWAAGDNWGDMELGPYLTTATPVRDLRTPAHPDAALPTRRFDLAGRVMQGLPRDASVRGVCVHRAVGREGSAALVVDVR